MKDLLGKADGKKLRKLYDDSEFLEKEYDGSIIGVDASSGGIIYHFMDVLFKFMESEKEEGVDLSDEEYQNSQEYADFYDNCQEQVLGLFNEFHNQYENGEGMIPPILFEDSEDVQNRGQ